MKVLWEAGRCDPHETQGDKPARRSSSTSPTLPVYRAPQTVPVVHHEAALETGLQLEDELPGVAHRQWTLSLPMPVRFQVVKQPALLKRLEVRLVQAVWRHQRATAKRLGAGGPLRGGGVC
ncbi:MAG: hypothetical protein Q8K32_04520, partial [Archangium sp.]|nr:hypothetical protein [Archangium sp.]